VEGDGPGAGVRHRVGEQQRLDLRLGKAAAMHAAEQADEAVDQHRRCRHRAGDVGDGPEDRVQVPQRGLRGLRRGIDRVDWKLFHRVVPFAFAQPM
jgi:hypothetical protein